MGSPSQLAALAATMVLVLTAACTSDPVGAAPEESTSMSARQHGDSKRCLARQGVYAAQLHDRIQKLTRLVLSRPDEAPAGRAVPLRLLLGKIERRVQVVCGDGRTPLVPLIELANSRSDEGVDEPLLRQIVAAYEEWARTVGKPWLALIVYAADPCSVMVQQIHVSYQVHRQPEPGGSRVWLEVVVANDWPERLYVDHGGTIRVTGAAPGGATRTYV